MLVLSRKPGEEILIGETIRLKIIDVSRSRIKLGIDAPEHLPIRRAELTPAAAEKQPQP